MGAIEAKPRAAWQGGWWHRARCCESPNQGPRPEGTAIDLVVLHSISLGLSLRQMRYRMARLGINVSDHGGD